MNQPKNPPQKYNGFKTLEILPFFGWMKHFRERSGVVNCLYLVGSGCSKNVLVLNSMQKTISHYFVPILKS